VRYLSTIGLCFVLALAAGCGGDYESSKASEQERKACADAVGAYLESVKTVSGEGGKVPAYLAEADSSKVLKVEKTGEILKALVEFSSATGTETRYVVIKKQGDKYVVTGVL